NLPERQGDGAVIDVRARLVMVSPVVWRADVLHPLRRVPEAFDAFIRSASLEHENGCVGAVLEAPRNHATRRARAPHHVVVTSGKYLAALNLMMKLDHGVSLLERGSEDAIQRRSQLTVLRSRQLFRFEYLIPCTDRL